MLRMHALKKSQLVDCIWGYCFCGFSIDLNIQMKVNCIHKIVKKEIRMQFSQKAWYIIGSLSIELKWMTLGIEHLSNAFLAPDKI